MPVYEADDQGYRIIGYNGGIEFYDPDRELQCEIFLGTDNRLYACGTSLGGGSDYVDLNGRYLRLDCSNDPLTSSLSIEGNVNLNKAGASVRIEGDHALSLEDGSGNRTSVVLGSGALTATQSANFIGGYQAAYNTTALQSVIAGYQAAYDANQGGATISPDGAIVIGYWAGYEATSLNSSVIIGYAAASSVSTTYPNAVDAILIGTYAGRDSQYASSSIGIGSYAHKGTSGDYNTAVGDFALEGCGSGTGYEVQYNVAIGASAMEDVTVNSDCQRNVAVGLSAGDGGTDLEDNVFIGYQSGQSANVTGCVFLGYQSGKSETTDNVLIIENSNDIVTPLIYGEFDNDLVRINGNLDVTGNITPGNVADDDTTPGIPVLFPVAISGGAAGDTDITIDGKHRVIDVWAQHTGGAGEESDTIQVKNGANAITDAMDWGGADDVIVRASSIDDANYEVADSGTLRVTTTDNDGQDDVGAGIVYVLAIPVA